MPRLRRIAGAREGPRGPRTVIVVDGVYGECAAKRPRAGTHSAVLPEAVWRCLAPVAGNRAVAVTVRFPDLAAINEERAIEGAMYKTSAVLVLLLHLFIFFHLPHPLPIAAMSVSERTYIMVKVGRVL